ncbi:hypothetical protein [Flavobacterium sp. MK4S-17]|uniref:hypothetical protein n=1 Tax=Flavobacterium sp. MK4S-17 TaxID=2543737 RepID=UPI00135B992E|nr:hypothetical protein [Flavobacterium sp. MK4S-17]
MNKFFKLLAAFVLTGFIAASCSDDDSGTVSADPDALNLSSELTSLLSALALNPNLTDCVSLDLPVTILVYDSDNQPDGTIVIDEETDLEDLIAQLDFDESYAFEYPLSINGFGGELITVNSNDEFLSALQDEISECENASEECDTENTAYTQLFNSLSGGEQFTMDTFTHEYTFSSDQGGTICSIGYKGETASVSYLIEILDGNDNVVYSGNHSFSDTAMEYVSIPEVSINANENYTIKRSIGSYAEGQGIGTVRWGLSTMLPATANGITVHQARFYGGGGSTNPDYGMVPYIDFAFKPL